MKRSRVTVLRDSDTSSPPRTHISPLDPAAARSAAPSSADYLLNLQRTIGNRAVQRLVGSSQPMAATPRIQRSGWWESLGETLGNAWETASSAAGSILDTLTSGGKGEEPAKGKKQPKRPPTPDDSVEYVVTDKQALIRTPPPDLDDTPYMGMIIPKGVVVKIINKHRKGSKWAVEVEIVSPAMVLPSGWTNYSNLSLNGSAPEPEEPSENPPEQDLEAIREDLRKIENIEPGAYEEQTGDAEKRQQALDKANASGAKNKAKLISDLKDAGTTPEAWFAKINPSATFLGVPIKGSDGYAVGGVHDELYKRLKVAEQFLMDETGKDEAALSKLFGIKSIGGLRKVSIARTKGASGISLHSFGLAIDISTSGPNPLIEQNTTWENPETGKEEKVKTANASVVDRAAQFVKFGMSEKFGIGEKASKGTGDNSLEKRVTQADKWWGIMNDASEAFKLYLQFETKTEVVIGEQTFKLDDLAAAYGRETGDVRSASDWQTQIAQDRENLQGSLGKSPEKGFLNLDKQLVMALVKAGLSWGGSFDNYKDIHHFDLRDGTIIRSAASSTAK